MDGDLDLPPWAGLSRRGLIVWGAAFAVSYALSAWAVKAFDLPGSYSPWYPPAGIMLAFLLVAGPRMLPVALAVRITSEEIYARYLKYLEGCAHYFRAGHLDVMQFTLVK